MHDPNQQPPASQKKSRLVLWILVAMAAGVALGFGLNKSYLKNENERLAYNTKLYDQQVSLLKQDPLLRDTTTALYKSQYAIRQKAAAAKEETIKAIDKKLEPFTILTDIFLRLIKMIVAPLVLSTLVVGVARVGDIKSVGRIGGKTMLWFISASLVSLLLGMALVNLFHPGTTMHLTPPPELTGIQKGALTLKDFITHLVPASVFDALAKNEILQIVVFSIFFGIATAAIGETGEIIIRAMDAIAHVILKITGYVMKLAPIAVFGAMTAIIAKEGIGIIKTYSLFIGEFYLGLFILWLLLFLVGYLIAVSVCSSYCAVERTVATGFQHSLFRSRISENHAGA